MADHAFLTVLKPDMGHQAALRQHGSTITQDSADPAAAQHHLGRDRTGETDSSPWKMRSHSVDRTAHFRTEAAAPWPGDLRDREVTGTPRHETVEWQASEREAGSQKTKDRFYQRLTLPMISPADNPAEPETSVEGCFLMILMRILHRDCRKDRTF